MTICSKYLLNVEEKLNIYSENEYTPEFKIIPKVTLEYIVISLIEACVFIFELLNFDFFSSTVKVIHFPLKSESK